MKWFETPQRVGDLEKLIAVGDVDDRLPH